MSPASAASFMWWSVTPVRASPFTSTQLSGARPRYCGSSEPCRLSAATRGSARSVGPRSRRYHTDRTRSGASARSASATSGRFGDDGVRHGSPCARARPATDSNQSPSARSSAWVTTATTSSPRASSAASARAPIVWYANTTVLIAPPRARGSLEHLADHVARPPPDFLVDAADVLADQAERQDLQADEEKEDREQGEHALDLGADQQTAQAQEGAEAETEERDEHADQAHELDRQQREPGEQVEVEPEQAKETVARASMLARGVVDRDLLDRRGEAGGEGRNELGHARARQDLIDDRAP